MLKKKDKWLIDYQSSSNRLTTCNSSTVCTSSRPSPSLCLLYIKYIQISGDLVKQRMATVSKSLTSFDNNHQNSEGTHKYLFEQHEQGSSSELVLVLV